MVVVVIIDRMQVSRGYLTSVLINVCSGSLGSEPIVCTSTRCYYQVF